MIIGARAYIHTFARWCWWRGTAIKQNMDCSSRDANELHPQINWQLKRQHEEIVKALAMQAKLLRKVITGVEWILGIGLLAFFMWIFLWGFRAGARSITVVDE